ncbi:hypothetical protein J6590_050931 [Homalodisca vitripennis]|nr:hypothetical protein J6590_050931 [Homalodisca vitripennis]
MGNIKKTDLAIEPARRGWCTEETSIAKTGQELRMFQSLSPIPVPLVPAHHRFTVSPIPVPAHHRFTVCRYQSSSPCSPSLVPLVPAHHRFTVLLIPVPLVPAHHRFTVSPIPVPLVPAHHRFTVLPIPVPLVPAHHRFTVSPIPVLSPCSPSFTVCDTHHHSRYQSL